MTPPELYSLRKPLVCSNAGGQDNKHTWASHDGDLKRKFLRPLQCDPGVVKKAYEVLRLVNATYADVKWDPDAESVMESMDGPLGILGNLQPCLYRMEAERPADLQTEQVGPAEAPQTSLRRRLLLFCLSIPVYARSSSGVHASLLPLLASSLASYGCAKAETTPRPSLAASVM